MKVAQSQATPVVDLVGGVTVNVHLNLMSHDPAKIRGVLACVETSKEFILYSDKKNYTIFVPRFQLAVCYMDGVEYSQDVSQSEHDWHQRVKMAMSGYPHFFEIQTGIDGQAPEMLQL